MEAELTHELTHDVVYYIFMFLLAWLSMGFVARFSEERNR